MTTTSAVVGGTVSPNGAPTTWHMEYATQAEFDLGSYPHSTADRPLGYNTGLVLIPFLVGDYTVSFTLDGLTSGTTYHIRIVASNSDGTTNGGDQSFTTS